MHIFTQNEPLTDGEIGRLGAFLKSCKGGTAMNVEQLDGFFAALIAVPDTVIPSEYYSQLFDGAVSDACDFGSFDEANEILGRMRRQSNTIASTLYKRSLPAAFAGRERRGAMAAGSRLHAGHAHAP
jgi:uncharacterized protein